MYIFTFLTRILGLALLSTAHPGEYIKRANTLQRRAYHSQVVRGYGACTNDLALAKVNARADLRRRSIVERQRQDLAARRSQQILNPNPDSNPKQPVDLREPLRKSHLKTDPSIGPNTPEDELFGDNGVCVLNPEGMLGPFYVTGEFIRSDITEAEPGVPMTIDAQFIDVETCEPVEGIWWDIWSCNSTGVYSGVMSWENDGKDDTSNLNATFLRGLQRTDAEGVAQFQTIFPGHYHHRATHLHVIAHVGNVTRFPNDTITGGTVAHIGQLFWGQDLVYEIERTYPYYTNTVPITPNSRDRLFLDEVEGTTSDPVFNYVKLGEDVQDGIFAWISVAVNLSASYDPSHNWRLTEQGSVSDSGGDSPV
ncbi:uncharacterized protein N7484_006012 [Penicillium longicatenatum]|uniref:uncharacterized protein n=1 Tax=Penicillium longicatenatum TaxID=1561947 RepID=UPI002546AC5E|nr:uncharacterized protein N7484_006012 [Penicillium longicatenatum]KAJ5643505.1 hypothetical protein N7484_006012 [Penicillium longicatenatum]